MTDLNKLILDLINENASVNEISQATGLSNKRLFYRLSLLKMKGYDYEPKYYYNGDIVYNILNKSTILKEEGCSILTSKSDNTFTALLISDIHLGSSLERLDLLDKVYDYCAKEGINIIINGGDLIAGLFGREEKRLTTYEDQIEYAIKNYPFDKSIINFTCLGNHDVASLNKTGQDLGKALISRRHDIVPIGYGAGTLNIQNDQIIVKHPSTFASTPQKDNYEPERNKLVLKGHFHESKMISEKDKLTVWIPPLCDILYQGYKFPGAILMNLEIKNGYFVKGTFTSLMISNNEIFKVGESQYDLSFKKDINPNVTVNKIKHIEERVPVKIEPIVTKNEKIVKNDDSSSIKEKTKEQKVLKKERMSQIEKFNARMNKKQ